MTSATDSIVDKESFDDVGSPFSALNVKIFSDILSACNCTILLDGGTESIDTF